MRLGTVHYLWEEWKFRKKFISEAAKNKYPLDFFSFFCLIVFLSETHREMRVPRPWIMSGKNQGGLFREGKYSKKISHLEWIFCNYAIHIFNSHQGRPMRMHCVQLTNSVQCLMHHLVKHQQKYPVSTNTFKSKNISSRLFYTQLYFYSYI